MSIEFFINTWKASSYDTVQVIERDANGFPQRIQFLRKGKIILELWIVYEDTGEWKTITTVKPKEEKK